jgi:hypothetical protein
MRWAGQVARMGEEKKVYTRKTKGRWEDVIRMDLREIGLGGGVDWIRLAQDRDRWRYVVK